jgi:STE24 endopeptidase
VELVDVVPEEKFHKSLVYGIDRFSFGLLESSFMFIEGLILILLGWLPFAWDYAHDTAIKFGLLSYMKTEIQQEICITIIFVCLLALHDTIIGLPFSLYSTFIIEQKHGFNKSTILLFFRDKFLGMVIGFVIGMPVLRYI